MMKKIIYLATVAMAIFAGCNSKGLDPDNPDIEQNGSIYGSVVANGEPVNAAAILLTPGGGTTITGSDGAYSFADLQPGRYELKVYKAGFQSFNKSIDIKGGKNEELAITLSASVGKLSLNKAYIDMGGNEGNNVAGFSISNSGATDLDWSITSAAGWISKIESKTGTVGANSSTAVVFTIDRSKLSSNSTDNHTTLIVRSTTAGDGSTAELLVTVFGTGDGTNTTIGNGEEYVVIGDLYVQTRDLATYVDWNSANTLCENSVVGDFTDWRLPTVAELATIYTKKEVIGGFDGRTYWGSKNSGVYSWLYFSDGTSGSTSYADASFNCRAVRKDILPEVAILPSTNMTENSIDANGQVLAVGTHAYTERGFVYGTNHNPSVSNTKVVSYTSKNENNFSATITGLTLGTTYYLRAYAINKVATVYSADEVTIAMSNQKPQVSTLPADNITETAVTLHGNIDSRGIPSYTEKGFCYSATFQNPTISEDKKVVSGTGVGAFSANLSGLTTGTTYYVRAYATNSEGTAYGQSISFKPESPYYVILSTAGLMVQKTDITGDNTVNWSTGNSLCENSTLGGYTDWRLPTKDELATLYNERNTIGGFATKDPYYWSSTIYSSYNGSYWYQSFSTGTQGSLGGSNSGRCRCVRSLP
jgi:hypothetical protein